MSGSRFSEVVANFSIVTPMFLGDANKEANRIRGSSIKGALCFWWRALYFSRFVHEAGGDVTRALENMKKAETRIFGGQKGQSNILISVNPAPPLQTTKNNEMLMVDGSRLGGFARYMGYGLMTPIGPQAGKLLRSCINSNQAFSVTLVFRPKCDEEDRKQVISALKLMGLIGGLGSRVRRGYGSIALKSITGLEEEWASPVDKSKYEATLRELIKTQVILSNSGTYWPVSAFASESKCFLVEFGDKSPIQVLDCMAKEFQLYRAWGYSKGRPQPEVNGNPSEMNFKDDHDWLRDGAFRGAYPDFVPERTAFGLPHNYTPNLGVVGPGDIDRRASPLMFHVHSTGQYSFGVITLLPTQFLPQNRVTAGGRPKNYNFQTRGRPVLEHFLTGRPADRTLSNGSTKSYGRGPYFSAATEIL